MEKKEIFEKVVEIFRTVFDDETLEINESTNSNDIEEWDSLENIGLIVQMEKMFNINFYSNETEKLKNDGDMVGLNSEKEQ